MEPKKDKEGFVLARVETRDSEAPVSTARFASEADRNQGNQPFAANSPSSLQMAASLVADAALEQAARTVAPKTVEEAKPSRNKLSAEGSPGDVRLVCMTTGLIRREKGVVPPLPLPPFSTWRKWLRENEHTAKHCALDWVDGDGKWWHTEVRGFLHHPEKYRVGQGEFVASGFTIYGVFILPGRTDPEDQEVIFDEKIECDYRVIQNEARKYGRKDKRHGDPGTGGSGNENVGLGGPAFKPSQSSNTYINHLLRQAGVKRKAPEGAVGWDTIPQFPYSSDADAYGP